MKSGDLNFLEPSKPLQASNGTALPLLESLHITDRICSAGLISSLDMKSDYIDSRPIFHNFLHIFKYETTTPAGFSNCEAANVSAKARRSRLVQGLR